MVGTMALIIVLSVFNGFESAVVSMFNVFDPPLEISLKEGKSFPDSLLPAEKIKQLPGVIKYTRVLEENALLRYKDKQYLATVKGVDLNFIDNSPLDTLLIEGDLILEADSFNFALAGFGIAYFLDLHIDDPEGLLSMYVPDRKKRLNAVSESSLRNEMIRPSGIFSVQQDFDNQYVFVPLRFASQLFGSGNEITAVNLWIKNEKELESVQEQVQTLAGPEFEVKNRLQQQELLYKTMKSEKWAVFLILTFILIIATFNVIGSITMLILDKRKDISTLGSLGANSRMIRKVFFIEGALITFLGAFLGLLLGGIICWLQQTYGFIRLNGGESFIMPAYPVLMKAFDFLLVFITVMSTGILATWLPVAGLKKKISAGN